MTPGICSHDPLGGADTRGRLLEETRVDHHLPAVPFANQPLQAYSHSPILSWMAAENARRRASERSSPFRL